MPPVSQAQRRFMWWAKSNPKQAGVKKSVSTEFTQADKGGKLPEKVKGGKPVKSRAQQRYSNSRTTQNG